MKFTRQRRAAFTLLELMIVLGIIGIMFGVGVPAFVRSHQKRPLQQSVSDLMEGLKQARATAILTGSSADLVFQLETRSFSVQKVGGEEVTDSDTRMANAAPKGFTGHIHEEINIELLAVNFADVLQQEEARVRFRPNGTSDEFTIVLKSSENEYRKISLEIITGLSSMEVDPSKFLKK